MDHKTKISIIGGDSRQVYAADFLNKYGYETMLCGFSCFNSFALFHPQVPLETALAADVVIFPLPYTRNRRTVFTPFSDETIPLSALEDRFTSGQTIFLGNAEEKLLTRLTLHGAYAYDYYKEEALTLYNARLTAEALLALVIDTLPRAILDAEIAVAGYGRVGFYTAQLFHLCGAKVTIVARSDLQLAKAATAGYTALPLAETRTKQQRFDCLINTIPTQIFPAQTLEHLNRDCLLIEAASAPYGIDSDAAGAMGFQLLKAFSLPGKSSPQSAGTAIAKTILQRIRR